MAPGTRAEAHRWYHQAVFDLRAAEWNFQGRFYNTACFLAQQSAEKPLKSLLYYAGARRQALLTHSIVSMIQSIIPDLPHLQDILEDARQLDLHYIPARYPNGLPDGIPYLFYGAETASRAIQAAEKILSTITEYYKNKGEQGFLEPPGAMSSLPWEQ